MNYENSDESEREKKIRSIKAEIARDEETLERTREILIKYDKEMEKFKEVKLYIEGLLRKVQELHDEDKILSAKQPESDEEWELFFSRMERIHKVYETIDRFDVEAEEIMSRIDQLVKESGL